MGIFEQPVKIRFFSKLLDIWREGVSLRPGDRTMRPASGKRLVTPGPFTKSGKETIIQLIRIRGGSLPGAWGCLSIYKGMVRSCLPSMRSLLVTATEVAGHHATLAKIPGPMVKLVFECRES